MKTILVFPGQGSQFVGMGKDLYDNSPEARMIFDEVDKALQSADNRKLSEIMFNGSIDELTLTANVQPAIFAVSAAMLKVSDIRVSDFVAGHSLGEYTALYAANSLTLWEVARLLRRRGELMQAAVPEGMGAMAVILGLEIDQVKEICEKAEIQNPNLVCDVANDNAPGQVVISGSKPAIEAAMELAKAAGAKRAMPLPLSVPPHSRLMQPIVEDMRTALNEVEFRTPTVPLISNMTAMPMTDTNEIKESLIYQVTHGVRWRESVLNFAGLGIGEVIEIGPGNVLTGLVSRIDPNLKIAKG
jgi:[acyl-carrier-protein] S-malonyltransferase